jgi:predicted PurR-regulated permease PerM
MNHLQRNIFEDLTARQVITATLVVVGVSLAFWLVYYFRLAFTLFFIAVFLGTAIRPLVDWLFSRGIPRAWGILVVYSALIIVLIGLGFLVVPLLIEQSAELSVRLPTIYQNLRAQWMISPSRLARMIAGQLPQIHNLGALAPTVDEGNPLAQVANLLSLTGQVSTGLLSILTVFLLAFYWALDGERTLRGLQLWLPSQARPGVRQLIDEIEEKVGGFLRGQALLCLIIGVAALAAYSLLGLPYALLLGLLAGIFEAIPVVGPALGAIPALLVALTLSNQAVLGVLIASVVIQGLENYLLVPRIMKKAVGANAIVTMLALITLSSLLGLAGALLAIPAAAIAQLLLDRFLLNRTPDVAAAISGRDYASMLRYESLELIQDIRKSLRRKEQDVDEINDEFEDELEKIAIRLESLIEQTNPPEGLSEGLP